MAHSPKRDAGELATVLLIATGDPDAPVLKRRLTLLGLAVDECGVEDAVQTTFVLAPEVVVLAGDPARDGGLALLERLAQHHATATTPVVVIGTSDGTAGAARAALRHGVVAILDRSSGVENTARRILAVVRELPNRRGQLSGVLGAQQLDQLVALLSESRRTGMLAVRSGTGAVLLHLVVRGEAPVEETIAELAARLRGVGASAHGRLRYEFIESSTVDLGALRHRHTASANQLHRLRLVLLERDAERARPLLEALRAAGCTTERVTDGGVELEPARKLVPSVVMVDGATLEDWGADVLREFQSDPLLCWASLLVLDYAKIMVGTRVDADVIASGIVELLQPDLELTTRVRARPDVETRLQVVGPARTLRALAASKIPLRVEVRHPRARVELSLVDGRVHEPYAAMKRGLREPVAGAAALATLLHMPGGRVRCTQIDPAGVAVGRPLDEALAEAAVVRPLLRRSDAPSTTPSGHAFADDEATEPADLSAERPSGSEVQRLVDRLEHLLGIADAPDDSTERHLALEFAFAPGAELATDEEVQDTFTYDGEAMRALRRRLALDQASAAETEAGAEPRPREPTIRLGSRAERASQPPAPLDFEDESTSQAVRTDELLPMIEEEESTELTSVDPAVFDAIVNSPFTPLASLEDDVEPTVAERVGSGPAPVYDTGSHARYDDFNEFSDVGDIGAQPALGVRPEYPPLDLGPPTGEEAAVLEEPPRGMTYRAALIVGVCAFAMGVGGALAFVAYHHATDPDPTTTPSAGASTAPTALPTPSDIEPSPSTDGDPARDAEARGGATPTETTEDAGTDPAIEEPPRGEATDGETDGSIEEATDATTQQTPPDADPLGVTTDPFAGRDEDVTLEALGIEPERDVAPVTRSIRVRTLNRRAAAARRRRRWDRAERSYLGSLMLDPRNAPATIGLVHVYGEQANHRRAILFAQRLVHNRPRDAGAHLLLSDAFAAAERPVPALAAARRALELAPRSRAARRRVAALSRR